MHIPHNKVVPYPGDAEKVAAVVATGKWAGNTELKAVEHELATWVGKKYAVCVSSGTAALKLSLVSIGVGPGDEVVVPAYSCVALANAVLSLGATPILADSANCLHITPETVKKVLTKKTKAVIAVDIFGIPAPILEIESLGVPTIEDSAHGFGFCGLGSHGRLSLASFYATKFLGCGEGGAVFTSDFSEAEYIRDLRDYVDRAPSALRQNYKMTDIAATLLRNRLSRLEHIYLWRKELAHLYITALTPLISQGIVCVPCINNERIWYRFVITTDYPAAKLIDYLKNTGIGADRPVERWSEESNDLLMAGDAFDKVVSLPFYEGLSAEDVSNVVEALTLYLQV